MPVELLIAELQKLSAASPGRRVFIGRSKIGGADFDKEGDIQLKLGNKL